MMEKGAASDADQVVFDLEDACAPSEKQPSVALVVEALRSLSFGDTIRCVRINDVTTRWCHGDIVDIVSGASDFVDCLVVPKVEDASHVHFVSHLLSGLEATVGRERRIGLELQIESPRGAVNLREIAAASDRTETIIFGPGDYGASLGIAQLEIGMIDERYPGHQWHWVISEVANHAHAEGLAPLDGPYADFNDESGFRESAQRARLLGYHGKWCIHPNQIPWANDVFSPTLADLQNAQTILDAYREATDAGRGAIAIDGKLVDEASRKIAEETVARARRAGLERPS
jgi:citrate lyase subunit beta/citryl-CoA lyase